MTTLGDFLRVVETLAEADGKQYTNAPKTKAGRRSVPIPKAIVGKIEAHLTPLGKDDLVFAAPKGDYLRFTHFYSHTWTPAVKKAGLSPLRLHDLRHTAVALWIAAGASPKEIGLFAFLRGGSVQLGHHD